MNNPFLSRFRFLAGLIFAFLAAAVWFGTGLASAARDEELAGEAMSAQPEPSAGPESQEPEFRAAGEDKSRPLLKLPEVVVKGERQFQITAERRDLQLTDPMAGTKETPADLAAVAMPGLNTSKDAPAAETITPKDHLLTLEGGLGPEHLAEARLVAGQELPHLNYLLRGEYDCGDYPETYGFRPFRQKANGGLDIRTDVIPGLNLTAGLTGQMESGRQPEGRPDGWGDWLDRASGGAQLQGEADLWNGASLKILGAYQSFTAKGAPGNHCPSLGAKVSRARADYEQRIPGFLRAELNLLASVGFVGQSLLQTNSPNDFETWEALRTFNVTGRMRLLSLLHLDIGIRVDDFQGKPGRSASSIIGRASLVLPTRSVIYAAAEPELHWEPVSDWIYRNPYPAVNGLPQPENVYGNYRVGWRQDFGDAVSVDLAWFKRDATNTPAWLDGAGTGLFTYANLPESHVTGYQAEMNIRYSPQLYQTLRYIRRTSDAGPGAVLPYTPSSEGGTELTLSLTGIQVALDYRYLGARFTAPSETEPALGAANLIGAKADVEVAPGWTVWGRLDNILNCTWSEWRGYPARGVTGLAGLRVNF